MQDTLLNPFAPEMFSLDEEAFLAALAPQPRPKQDISSSDVYMTTAPEIEEFDMERLDLLANKEPKPVHNASFFYLPRARSARM